MELRPCIDVHNGAVKQIVGGSIKDGQQDVIENYTSVEPPNYYAGMYKALELKGGHIINLNKKGTKEYEYSQDAILKAIGTYRYGMQVGGGIDADNAGAYIEAGASHIIVTSYAFEGEKISYSKVSELSKIVGKDRLVIDLSCRKREDKYYVVTNRWQRFTSMVVNINTLRELEQYCDEFLIHGVDVEGKMVGIDRELIGILATWDGIPITYAGGISSLEDIDLIKEIGKNRINVTIGSALNIFGGSMKLEDAIIRCR